MNIESNQEFSNAGYEFLMFLTDYYKRVGDLNLTFDEMMVLNTVAAQLGLKSSEALSIEEILNLKDEKLQKFFKSSKLSILSIANILNQPKESIRRRVNKLIKLKLLAKDKNTNGIMLTAKYSEISKNFSMITLNKFVFLIKNFNKKGFLSDLLNEDQNKLKYIGALNKK